MKKTNKKNFKKQSVINPDIYKDIRGFGVLLEHVDEKVGLIAEQHGDIKKILDSHTEMIGNLAVDVSLIKDDISFIKNSLKKKVDYDEFTALERRVLLLEKRR